MAAFSSSEKGKAWALHLLDLLQQDESPSHESSRAEAAKRGIDTGLAGGPALVLQEACTLAEALLQGE